MRTTRFGWWALCSCVMLAGVFPVADARGGSRAIGTRIGAGASCTTVEVGNDTSHANTSFGILLGRAANQVFYAADTLISAITVWRAAQPETLQYPMQLFITETEANPDTTILPGPAPGAILLTGPTALVPYTDGIHPIPVSFAFDPPFALPHRGYFSFAIKEAECNGAIVILGDTLNRYADGVLYKTVPFNDCSGLGNSPRVVRSGMADLIFEVDFCELGVPVLGETWGRLKARYH